MDRLVYLSQVKSKKGENSVEDRALEIRKSTRLVDARTDLPEMAQKLFCHAVSKLRGKEQGEQTITFDAKELARAIGTESKSFSKELRLAAEALVTKIYIPDYDRNSVEIGWTLTALVAAVSYRKGSSTVRVTFSSSITPHLINLHNHFTKIDLAIIMRLRGRYSGRFYEWCKSRMGDRDAEGNVKAWKMDLVDLRKALGIKGKEYPRYVDFERRVLLPAERELAEHAKLLLTHEPRRKERAVVALRFRVTHLGTSTPEPPAEPAPPAPEPSLDLFAGIKQAAASAIGGGFTT